MGFMKDLCIWRMWKNVASHLVKGSSVPFPLKELWTSQNVCIFSQLVEQLDDAALMDASSKMVLNATHHETPWQWSRFASRLKRFQRPCGHYNCPTNPLTISFFGLPLRTSYSLTIPTKWMQWERALKIKWGKLTAQYKDALTKCKAASWHVWWRTVDTSSTSYNVNLFTMKKDVCPINISDCVHPFMI